MPDPVTEDSFCFMLADILCCNSICDEFFFVICLWVFLVIYFAIGLSRVGVGEVFVFVYLLSLACDLRLKDYLPSWALFTSELDLSSMSSALALDKLYEELRESDPSLSCSTISTMESETIWLPPFASLAAKVRVLFRGSPLWGASKYCSPF